MEAAYISKILATLPITTWCNNISMELTSTAAHCESLKSVTFVYMPSYHLKNIWSLIKINHSKEKFV
jgi:hypothetical protein